MLLLTPFHLLLSTVFALGARAASGSDLCPSDTPINIKAPHENLWKPLTEQETLSVQEWLYDQKELNLTQFTTAGISDNSIWLIELITPNKTEAVSYLDSSSSSTNNRNSNSSPPKRYARAILFNGGYSVPHVKELQVGPLPISSETKAVSFSYIYQNSTVPGVDGEGVFPFNARTTYGIESTALGAFIVSFMTDIKDPMNDLIGGAYTGSEDDKLTFSWQGPNSFDGNWRRYWLFFMGRGFGAQYLSPTGFFVYVDTSGSDASTWYVRRVVYNHQVFQSLDDFKNAWQNGSIKKGTKINLDDDKWATRQRQGEELALLIEPFCEQRPLDDRVAPESTNFNGSRIRADREEGYVEWMDWSFYTGFNRDTGLTLWDIRFKGEKIIYEISIQEALAQYSGNDPIQSTTAYLDRHYGIGEETRQVLMGYDCPHGALTFNTSYYSDSKFAVNTDAICIFEQDLGFPTSRHSDPTNGWYGSTKGTALHVRSMATVYNYDYMFSYIFYLEGTVEILMGASGYLQATYWDGTQDDYGTRIHDTTMGSVHTHVVNYKVDLDVGGTANSLQTIDLVQEDVKFPWFDEDDPPTKQLRLQKTWVENETSFSVQGNNNNNGQRVLLIGNKEKKNAWGQERMYRIMPGYHTIHNAVKGSGRVLNSAKWGEDDVFIVKHKDTEPSSSTTWNQQMPIYPPVDFSKITTPAESIDQEDLVVYLNLGMHHVPRAEDTPNTLFTDSRSSFFIAPFNYFDDEPSRDIRNAVLLVQDPNSGKYGVEESGSGDDDKTCTPRADVTPAYIGQVETDLSSSG
ncbi:hypothetical protein M407DRAFT_30937 [Tulasnella calospora MUT 4182]|uniref:Amine oxidase n=1 Tax=Tulasnella calospora MUT 4182 TaxID=1051891 RepID=A0A0C3KDD5_9AGAM|nr:hypothetical protein M407DRAFT_30937 [Tulasnella calospora MUT 4182]